MDGGEKQARVNIHPDEQPAVDFAVGDEPVRVIILPDAGGTDEQGRYVVGFDETIDESGDRQDRFSRLPKIITEGRRTTVEFYESHEKLVKRAGAIGVLAGVVTVGSLVVRRLRDRS